MYGCIIPPASGDFCQLRHMSVKARPIYSCSRVVALKVHSIESPSIISIATDPLWPCFSASVMGSQRDRGILWCNLTSHDYHVKYVMTFFENEPKYIWVCCQYVDDYHTQMNGIEQKTCIASETLTFMISTGAFISSMATCVYLQLV